jgi:hypothetical protein
MGSLGVGFGAGTVDHRRLAWIEGLEASYFRIMTQLTVNIAKAGGIWYTHKGKDVLFVEHR